jgi:two-component system, chemotaxis family, protein-glutamate methylesterase/glutaminase
MEKDQLNTAPSVVLIGGSAGSTSVLLKIFSSLKPGISFSIVLVLHRKSTPDFLLGNLLSSRSPFPVKEAEEKEKMLPGIIYIAPPDYHLLFERDYTFSLDVSEKINYSRPSIDVSFSSAALAYGDKVAAILLSGANSDGTEGLQDIKKYGGNVAVQDSETAESPYMPLYAIERIEGIRILKAEEIAEFMQKLTT